MKERQIVNAQEMRQLDRLTIETKDITSFELMQQAGKSIFKHICRNGVCELDQSIVVIAGTGNNGGDALIVAHHLFERNVPTKVIMVGDESLQSLESKQASHLLHKPVIWINSLEELKEAEEIIESATTIIDGLFGIGLSREIDGIQRDIIELINHSYAQVISIDIPSGINADNGTVMGIAVEANHTVIIQNYKQGNLLNDALDYSGEMHLLDIGILQTIFPEEQILLPRSYINNKIPKRKHNSYKYNFGNVMTIGGSKGLMGAPLITGYAAMRTGSGLSHVLYNEHYLAHINNIYPDIMVNTYQGIEEIPQLVRNKSAIVFGPGLGRNDDINLEVLSYLLSTNIPLVIDADGIYYLKQLLKDYSERPNIIVTPHYQEMATFLGIPITDVKKEPVLYAKNIAHTYNLTVILKGVCTIITNDQSTFFSTHGNPGLATAGTGDVLSGITGSLLGRGLQPLEAAKMGVLIHSLAGKYAMIEYGEESMTASDVTAYIPKVIKNART